MLNPELTAVEVEGVVHAAIARVMQAHGLPVGEIRGEDKLNATLGLRSLDLAELVFELETAVGADPFEHLVPITSVRTVDDLVAAYRRLFDTDGGESGDAQELLDARRESQRRREKRESGL